jgi:hypothetical protein
MAGMELLQFHRFLYSALEEVNAEYEAPATLPREQKPPLFGIWKGEIFYLRSRFITRLLGCPASTEVTVPTQLSAVTHICTSVTVPTQLSAVTHQYPSFCTNSAIRSNTSVPQLLYQLSHPQ